MHDNQYFYLGNRADGTLKWTTKVPMASEYEFLWHYSHDDYVENVATGFVLCVDNETLMAVEAEDLQDSRQDAIKKFRIERGTLYSRWFREPMTFVGYLSEMRLVPASIEGGFPTETIWGWPHIN